MANKPIDPELKERAIMHLSAVTKVVHGPVGDDLRHRAHLHIRAQQRTALLQGVQL
ncbi:hypothetical protein [Enterobacter ludwigii]|jgi:hypothetical protein|uniref:hypothetical protein n=1 Tax=Enterobacter ludwigii TaxID=299767 RepID=UPI0013D5454A|nr:hypothetical protein [Enterobacter ludwigii]